MNDKAKKVLDELTNTFTINLSNMVFYSIGFLIGYFVKAMKG